MEKCKDCGRPVSSAVFLDDNQMCETCAFKKRMGAKEFNLNHYIILNRKIQVLEYAKFGEELWD